MPLHHLGPCSRRVTDILRGIAHARTPQSEMNHTTPSHGLSRPFSRVSGNTEVQIARP